MTRVLVVEDDPSVQELVSDLLEGEGYSVSRVATGPAALEAVRLSPPDAIVLDLMLPEIAGLDVLEAIRAVPETRLIPVVILTALVDEGTEWAGWAGGCDYFLTKPFDIRELVAAVRRAAPPIRASA